MNFFIKRNSTLPLLKYPLTQDIRERFDITDDRMNNIAVTFSMVDSDTGLFKIANVAADLLINRDRVEYPDEVEYTLTYKFKLFDTKTVGNYIGEFKVDFLGDGNCGKLTLPVDGVINIFIKDSITKTTVI